MALIHWWPLNGNLNDYGTNPVTLTNNGATINDNGKIGRCYKMDSYMYLNNFTDLSSGNFSVCYWVKYTAYPAYNEYCICVNGTSSSDMLFSLGICGNGTANSVGYLTVNASTSSATLELNKWYHVCLVYNGTNGLLYLNGSLVKTYNNLTLNRSATYLTLNGRNGSRPLSSGTSYLNDMRLYNMALSESEIKEISKALILHYDFENPYIEGTTNLAANIAGTNYISKNVETYATSVKGKTTYGNNIYTFRVYIRNTSDHSLKARVSPYNASDSDYSTFQGNSIASGAEGYSTVTVDLTDTSKWNGKAVLYIQNGNAGTVPTNKTFYIKEVQFEQKDHATPFVNGTRASSQVYDKSGFENHGISNNVEIVSTTSNIGNYNARFDGSTSVISNNNFIVGNNWSYGCWVKSASSNRGWEALIMLKGPTSTADSDVQLGFWTYPSSTRMESQANGSYNSGISYTYDNTWKHLFATYDGSSLKTYINGSLVNTTTISNSLLSRNYLSIGARAYSSSSWASYFKGEVNDVKLYATTLSDTEVANLYQQSAVVERSVTYKTVITDAINGFNGIQNQLATLSDLNLSYTYNGSNSVTIDTLISKINNCATIKLNNGTFVSGKISIYDSTTDAS